MTDEESFLRLILDAPNDRTLGLIFADWLDERGDPRGEIVRLRYSCPYPTVPPTEGSPLGRRLRQLSDEHGDPLEGLSLFRGEMQRCHLLRRTWFGRTWELTGPLSARIEYNHQLWETVSVNGQRVASTLVDPAGCVFHFLLRAPAERVSIRLTVEYRSAGLTIAAINLTADGFSLYREGDRFTQVMKYATE